MIQGPELPEAVAAPTVARSVWIFGPVAASGVRLPPWPVSSREPQRAARASRTAGEVGLWSRARKLPETVPGPTVAASLAGVLP